MVMSGRVGLGECYDKGIKIVLEHPSGERPNFGEQCLERQLLDFIQEHTENVWSFEVLDETTEYMCSLAPPASSPHLIE